jgi:uncharacterized protein YdeI (YjbR/CyaY-like superfamily)
MDLKKAVSFQKKTQWRTWLENNHMTAKEVRLLHYKKSSGKQCLNHVDAVEEALCFGWIDSTLKKIDDERFILKFSPRKPKSVWSKINKEKAEQLIAEGRMTAAGFQAIDQAKKQGLWDAAYTNKVKERLPSDLKQALMEKPVAWKHFQRFANSYRNMYIGWVKAAKTQETRERRINEVVKRSVEKKKPGL